MTVIEISAEEFARANKGLITVLKAVQQAGSSDGIPTRKLLHKIHMIGYGQTLIDRAEKLGYIIREEREPEGKGAWLVVNKLSPKGKALLRKLSI